MNRVFLPVLSVLSVSSTLALIPTRATPSTKRCVGRYPSGAAKQTALHALKPSLSSLLFKGKRTFRTKFDHAFEGEENSARKRERKRERFEELLDEDFLQASDTRAPQLLVHERDFFRQSMRMEAWDEYVLVSILCTSISYGALQTFEVGPDHEGIFLYDTVLKTGIQVAAAFGVMSGLYSSMVFALSILYGKTALGLERDSQYDIFLDNTLDIRNRAFRAFSLSIGFFSITVFAVLVENLPSAMVLPVGGVMMGVLFVGFRDWKQIVDHASVIFASLDVDDDY